MEQPILITGAARSGTSMVAGIINICGAYGGTMFPPNKNNKKGMFENIAIREKIVKPFLREIKADPKGQYPLPKLEKLKIPIDWKKRIEHEMRIDGYKEGKWMYKGAKMCLFYPVWNYAFPNAKWIIVRRRDDDIVNSCLHTGFMNAFDKTEHVKAVGALDERDAWYWWVRQHNKLFVEMIEKGLNCKQIWPERMIYGDYSQMYEMLEWLGLPWKSEITDFIEPQLYHAREKIWR